MPLFNTILTTMLLLGLGAYSGCGASENEQPASETRTPPPADAPAKQPESLGETVERRVDEAAGGVRGVGERVEAGADKAADAIERAGERAHTGVDETQAQGAEAKQAFIAKSREELARLDQALRELETDSSTAGQQAQRDLRAARDRTQRRIDELEKQADEAWTSAKQEVEQALAKLRADIEARRSS